MSGLKAFTVLMVAVGLYIAGCSYPQPLSSPHLQNELKDPLASVILFHFVASNRRYRTFIPKDYNLWFFAVANESSGWNFRQLDKDSMIIYTSKEQFEQVTQHREAGWVTFLVPPGDSYIAVSSPFGRKSGAIDSDPLIGLDFIDMQRYVLHVSRPGSFIYAGTVTETVTCLDEKNQKNCKNEYVVSDDTELARKFVNYYKGSFNIAAPLETEIMHLPASRTIAIPLVK